MSVLSKIRWNLVGILGKGILWLWAKSARITVIGDEPYQDLRNQGKPVILLIWHGRIFLVPYFFRRKRIMPLISPSEDGEIAAQIMARWGYKILRGSGSHSVVKAWNEMKRELERGGEVIIVPDGPRGPDRRLKLGALKLSQETGAHLVPFTFSSSRRKNLQSWDHFLVPKPFSKIVVLFGKPGAVPPYLGEKNLEQERKQWEQKMINLDKRADRNGC